MYVAIFLMTFLLLAFSYKYFKTVKHALFGGGRMQRKFLTLFGRPNHDLSIDTPYAHEKRIFENRAPYSSPSFTLNSIRHLPCFDYKFCKIKADFAFQNQLMCILYSYDLAYGIRSKPFILLSFKLKDVSCAP